MIPAIAAFVLSGGESILRGMVLRSLPLGVRLTDRTVTGLIEQLFPAIQTRLREKGYTAVANEPRALREVLTTTMQAMAHGRLIQHRRDGDRRDDPRSTYPGSQPDTDTRTYTVRVRIDDGTGRRTETMVDVTAARPLSRNEIFDAAMRAAEDQLRRGQVTVTGGLGGDAQVDMQVLTAYRGSTLQP